MFYLSKGILMDKKDDAIVVGHIGNTYTLTGHNAEIWSAAYQKVGRGTSSNLNLLSEQGIIEMSTSTNPMEAAYQMINRCILYVLDTPIHIMLSPSCRRLLRWITHAGFCLNASELIRIQELSLPEMPYLNGHSQEKLICCLYQNICIPLDQAMLSSPAFSSTMMDLLTLIHNQYVRLL